MHLMQYPFHVGRSFSLQTESHPFQAQTNFDVDNGHDKIEYITNKVL